MAENNSSAPLKTAGVSLAADRANRIYVAGPMTGLPDFNFTAFNAAANELRVEGWHVENPAEHGIVDGAQWSDYMHTDLQQLSTCCAIYLLPGWSKSRGATLEAHVAQALGMAVYYAPNAETQAVAAQAAPAAVAVPAVDQYLCQAWGETDLPAVAIVVGLDAVKQFLIAHWLGSADHQADDGTNMLEEAMTGMQEEWEQEGKAWQWQAQFEIGGVSVQRVDNFTLALPATEDSSAGDLATMTHGEATAALAINSALHRIRTGNPADAIEPLQHALHALAHAEVQAEPVAWQTFDGEGGYDYRSYEHNESYMQDWDRCNPKHKGWVKPLYAAPQAQPADALDAARYRWLRAAHDRDDDSVTIFVEEEQHGPGHLDSQIDAAMATAQEGGNAAKEA